MNTKWKEFVAQVQNKKMVCYGAGVNASLMLRSDKFQQFVSGVCFFVDSDIKKVGKEIGGIDKNYTIYNIDKLDSLDADTIVIITISDYVNVGKMLDEKNIVWFSWTVVSTAFNFEKLNSNDGIQKSKMFLFNTPDYVNLGDHAIAVAEDIYIREHFGEYYEFGSHSCYPDALEYLKKYITEKDILLFQGGGNLGSLWRVNEEIFRNLLKNFSNNNVIVFPQSIYYGDSEEEKCYFKESKKIYNEHKNLTICVRDERSYEFVKKSYACKCLLLPDMVLTLNYDKQRERTGIGVLLRDDKEKLTPCDMRGSIDELIKIVEESKVPLTHHPVEFISDRKERIAQILEEYASCKLVITDRLHGMIFSAITNTPCIAFDNSYHKVSGVYKKWLKKYKYIECVDSFSKESLLSLIREKLELRDCLKYNTDTYKREFDVLTKHINNLLK